MLINTVRGYRQAPSSGRRRMASTPANGGGRSSSQSKVDEVEKLLKTQDEIIFCIALVEWAGNAVGTVAFLWATVVLLGSFGGQLSRVDFWFSAIMVFVEGSRVFIRNDASMNQWLFGSTKAFRWENLVSPRGPDLFGLDLIFVVVTGVGISLTPIHFRPEVVGGILKVAFLFIISQLFALKERGRFAQIVVYLLVFVAVCGGIVGVIIMEIHQIKISRRYKHKHPDHKTRLHYTIKFLLLAAWALVTPLLAKFVLVMGTSDLQCVKKLTKTTPLLFCVKFLIASMLACFPLFQEKLASYYEYVSITASVVLYLLSYVLKTDSSDSSDSSELPNHRTPSTREKVRDFFRKLSRILDRIQPILFFWSLMFPLPGIHRKLSYYMLLSVIAMVLSANLQIPVAILQVVLSILRLRSLLGHHDNNYFPLPDGASQNLVPSILVFFMMELFQGSSYILATILGLISLSWRTTLVRDLEFEEPWGSKALSLYERQVLKERAQKGLFPSKDDAPRPSLISIAIESLGSTSSETKKVGLRVLDHFLKKWKDDDKSEKKLIAEIVRDATYILAKTLGLVRDLTIRIPTGQAKQRQLLCSSLNFVRSLAGFSGKIGFRFRQELWKNPSLLDSLEDILALEDPKPDLCEPVMGIIAKLALDEATRQEIGSNQFIIGNVLMHAFPDVENGITNDVKKAAWEALANLTGMSRDNCSAVLQEGKKHILIEKLIDNLEDEDYTCAAAHLLHNLCENSKLMDNDSGDLKSAQQKVMEIIWTKEGKQLEAALHLTSQIGYVVPENYVQQLESNTDAAKQFVKTLVVTLKSNRKPCREYPRIAKDLVEMVISTLKLCPGSKKNLQGNGG